MEKRDFQLLILSSIVVLSLAFTLQSCNHLGGTPPPPLPDPPRIITFNAKPPEIGEGGVSILTWETYNASSVSISGLGQVPLSGSRTVSPKRSTTYELTAANAAGETTKKARVIVGIPLK
jgi:peptidoglycan-associated lipoprotein